MNEKVDTTKKRKSEIAQEVRDDDSFNPAGYNDKKQKGKKDKNYNNFNKRKSTNIQMNEKVDTTKKRKSEIAKEVRDDDSFLAGISQESIQTFGMYIVVSLFLVNIY